ncbi:unnamed protein product [Rhizophagus irregularis]|nr:unnamed protein product [Rhizophagus irregularis]CAB5374751.1 unnamed protein product [Rhizophagus irregularis]
MNELWKPGRETREGLGFKRTNYGNLDVRQRNDQDLKKKNELWKPGRETKLNDQDLKEQTMEGWYNSHIVRFLMIVLMSGFSDIENHIYLLTKLGKVVSSNDILLLDGEYSVDSIHHFRVPVHVSTTSYQIWFQELIEPTLRLKLIRETAITSILSKMEDDLSKLHQAIILMFKLMVSTLPEKLFEEISSMPVLYVQFNEQVLRYIWLIGKQICGQHGKDVIIAVIYSKSK